MARFASNSARAAAIPLERVTDKWVPVIGKITRFNKELECDFDSIKT